MQVYYRTWIPVSKTVTEAGWSDHLSFGKVSDAYKEYNAQIALNAKTATKITGVYDYTLTKYDSLVDFYRG